MMPRDMAGICMDKVTMFWNDGKVTTQVLRSFLKDVDT